MAAKKKKAPAFPPPADGNKPMYGKKVKKKTKAK